MWTLHSVTGSQTLNRNSLVLIAFKTYIKQHLAEKVQLSHCSLPGKHKVHEAEHSDCQECDGVRLIEEIKADILHLLLVYHSEM